MSAADPIECPYVGLDSFESAHADYFFGRGQEGKVIADHVVARAVTVLYGASGVGKSSILNVGLTSALKQISERWRATKERRQREVGTSIVQIPGAPEWIILRLREWHNPETLERQAIDELLRQIDHPRRRRDRLRFAPLLAWIVQSTGRPLLIILDQFEEYFLYRDQARMQEFERTVGGLIARRDLSLHVLFGIRDDALHLLDQLRAFVPGILETTIELRGLSDGGIREAIVGPVERYNASFRNKGASITVEDGLVEALIRQLKESDATLASGATAGGERRIELPYLQLALTELWAAEGGAASSALRQSTLVDRLGGVGRIVRDHVNDVMGELNDQEQTLCARMFDRLVTAIGGKIAYPTAALATADVVGPGVSEQMVNAVLNKLTGRDERILKPVTTNGLPGFEIFHDVLGPPVLEWTRRFNEQLRVMEETRRLKDQEEEARAQESEVERQKEFVAISKARRERKTSTAEGIPIALGSYPPKPHLTVRVGFAGHRPNKLEHRASAVLKIQLQALFAIIENAANENSSAMRRGV